jgi:hypothetical protein
MQFTVNRVSPSEITMSGNWEGNYAFGTDIVFIEQPIIERLVSTARGVIKGIYTYVLVRSDGTRIPVETFSTYRFTPIEESSGLLDVPQARVTTNAFFWEQSQLRLTVVGQGVMLPAFAAPGS